MNTTINGKRLVDIRRALHQIPESGFTEHKTQAFLLEEIRALNSSFVEIQTWKTGILVLVRGRTGEKTIGWRSDMDGLPMKEETGLPFSSGHEGMMHACGHDLHMTLGLAALTHFAAHQPEQNLLFLFQPAEEGPGGAEPMLQSEAFRQWRPDEIYALHIAPELPVGTAATKPGILFANTSELFVDFYGKGGHAAYPHKTEDMVVAVSHFVNQLQTITARNVPPLDAAVVTIGKLEAGTKQNVIAGHARAEGTIRTLSTASMQEIKTRIEKMTKGIESSFSCRAEIDYGANYCQVYNNEQLTSAFTESARQSQHVTFQACDKAMTGEDFGYFLEGIPGLMFWLGVGSEAGLHSPELQPDEGALEPGVAFLIEWLSGRSRSASEEA
ncbi:N-acetyldiaminopimelate deacetylase [Alkalicoccus chagannorensis]|uniref:N-acetyldiaminopimelate deacetylase n=1 Tax=Alkalicoccus chagannorensis TaxID=427072 RepID=UPI00042202DC|nr:N-acetyldiaminopimelate deacetylase [Alkalicoccus chagannorensis]